MYSGVIGAPHRLQAVRPSTRLAGAKFTKNKYIFVSMDEGFELPFKTRKFLQPYFNSDLN
jgi:hypothetical protein